MKYQIDFEAVPYHIVASTGRTATTYIAAALNQVEGVTACHEGYVGARKDNGALLPLINLENRLAYQKPVKAYEIVSAKRSIEKLQTAARRTGSRFLIDVAYYNATICQAVLEIHPATRMAGIVRDCESFVRSATTVDGEDLLPVGWPSPDKPLSQREKFIEMGRIKPLPGSKAAEAWKDWTAIERNIWLWQETNLLLRQARERFGERVLLLSFSQLKNDWPAFWQALCTHFDITPNSPADIEAKFINKKSQGYQVGPIESWQPTEQAFAARAEEKVGFPQ